MAKGATIKISGLDKLIKKFGAIPENIKNEVEAELQTVAEEFVNRATVEAPQDIRSLANAITSKKVGVMKFEVVSPAPYSPFVEFGTKSRAKIPAEYASFAAKFRGKGGSAGGKGFYDSILAWVKRKGLTGTYSVKTRKREGGKVDKQIEDEQVAFAIYVSIMRHGIRPHPYFFKQVPIARVQMNARVEKAVKEALK